MLLIKISQWKHVYNEKNQTKHRTLQNSMIYYGVHEGFFVYMNKLESIR